MSFSEENCSALGDFSDDDVALDYCNNSEVTSFCLNECQVLSCEELIAEEASVADIVLEISLKILLFFLLAGFAATVDYKLFLESFKSKGVYVGLACQFVLMPFMGFITILMFQNQLSKTEALMVILITSSPGGAYSNWFCSVFNADLSLSIAMTTTSTFLAVVFLPLNIFIYMFLFQLATNNNSDSNESEEDAGSLVSQLPFLALFSTIGTVIAGVFSGLMFGYFLGHKWQRRANIVGNVAGVLLQVLGLFASGTSCAPPWEQPFFIFVCVIIPLFGGAVITFLISNIKQLRLPKPQRTAVTIEAAYQNQGVAVAVAVSLGSAGRAASVIPVLYGVFQGGLFLSFSAATVIMGWSLTPPNTPILKMLFDDFQDLIAVHPHYEQWRERHPHAMKNYTEEDLEHLREILAGNHHHLEHKSTKSTGDKILKSEGKGEDQDPVETEADTDSQ